MPEKRNKHDREFRKRAVRIVEETSTTIAQVAHDLRVNQGTPGNWVARSRENTMARRAFRRPTMMRRNLDHPFRTGWRR